jgi:phosphoesterase RecJ-like protein
MELTAKQQIIELIRGSQRILLSMHTNPDGDALGSSIALFLALKKIGKDVSILSPSDLPKLFQFLPKISEVKNTINSKRDFIISVNTREVKIDKLGYKNYPEEGKLDIILSSENGKFSDNMVTFKEGQHKFDLIIVLDSPDLDRLEGVYDQNADLFYEIPVINVDHHSGNDHFGKVNWVDLTATSTAEILVALIESLGRDKSLFDPDIATCLLTGLITDTGSFQNSNTTPKSFTVAAQLIAAGARQQEIIKHVFKTRELSTLKLWGKVLSHVQEVPEFRFVYSAINKNDFLEANARDDEAGGVIDELLKTVPNIDFALLLTERNNGVHGGMRGVQKGIDVSEIAKLFNGGGHEMAAAFHMPNTVLLDVENSIINKIKAYQSQKLNINSFNESTEKENNFQLEMPPIEDLHSNQ